LNVPKIFWIALAVFEVAFGTAIFMVTRSYYRDQNPTEPLPSVDIRSLDPAGSSAVTAIASADVQSPRTPDEIAQLADSHFANRQYEAAAVLYEQLLEQDRANADLLNNLALTLHYIGRSEEALRRIDEGIAIDPDHQRIRLTQGFVLSQMGRSAEAVTSLNTAIELGSANEIADSARRMLAEIAVQ
jgi:Flp pilus assembly protein TadD